MKVKDLEVGNLYRFKTGAFCSIKERNAQIEYRSLKNKKVSIVYIWKQDRQNVSWREAENLKKPLLYLGCKFDEWHIDGIHKHHYFLYDGKKVLVDNYCIGNLEVYKNEETI